MYTDMLKAIIKGFNLDLYYIFVAAYIVAALALLFNGMKVVGPQAFLFPRVRISDPSQFENRAFFPQFGKINSQFCPPPPHTKKNVNFKNKISKAISLTKGYICYLHFSLKRNDYGQLRHEH